MDDISLFIRHFLRLQCVLVLIILCFGRHIAAGPHMAKLLRTKLSEDRYLVESRPVANENETLTVDFGISLLQIREVDMKNELLRSNIWLQYRWRDYQLTWNESEFGGVSTIVVPASKLWTPDILLYNSADKDIDSKIATNILVSSDGRCTWIPPGLFESSCSIDISWFPFDDQTCFLKFGSWTYNGHQLDLRLSRDSMDLSNYVPNGEWNLVEAPARRYVKYYPCCEEPYPDVKFHIRLRRRALYYNLYVIVPTAAVAALTLLAFLLPPDSGEKIGLGITVLLSLTVFQLIIAEKVPESSHAVPLIAMFVGVVMFFCAMSLLLSVLVLSLHHRSPKTHHMPNWVRVVFCDWLAWMLLMKKSRHDDSLSRSLIDKQQTVGHQNSVEDALSDIHLTNANKEMDDVIGGTAGVCEVGMSGVGVQLAAILAELRLLTVKLKEESRDKRIGNEWKFVAMVLDRFCFWIFVIFFIVSTIVVFRQQLF